MIYSDVVEGRFIDRPNRFIARVLLEGREETVHVKNTGRCAELLLPGVKVWLCPGHNPNRKTGFDLISVEHQGGIINIDSAAPNRVFGQWASRSGWFGRDPRIYPERKYGNSRFDFYIEGENGLHFVEVKGVTLRDGETALFPDAPTQRGVKHIHELIDAVQEGYSAWLVFVVQMKGIRAVRPNWHTHPAFGEAMAAARDRGVHLMAMDCIVTRDTIRIDRQVPVEL